MTALYNWLARATKKQYVSRIGEGTRWDPWRYPLIADGEPIANPVGAG